MNLLVNIDVPDIAKAEAFYRDAFGLEANRRLGEDCVEMLSAGTPIYLLKKAAGTSGAGNSIRDYARHWTPVHVDIVVDNLESALARALRAGAVQEGDIREAAWGRIVQIADPFGHGWCLLQFLGHGYDEIAT
jgi:lactoylglutathione lyase